MAGRKWIDDKAFGRGMRQIDPDQKKQKSGLIRFF